MSQRFEGPRILTDFNDIWYKIFLYCLGTVIFMHCLGALVALRSLHKHRIGRYLPVIIVLFGLIYPVTGGIITSCCIAWIYSAAGYGMEVHMCAIYGVAQGVLLLIVSFVRIYGGL